MCAHINNRKLSGYFETGPLRRRAINRELAKNIGNRNAAIISDASPPLCDKAPTKSPQKSHLIANGKFQWQTIAIEANRRGSGDRVIGR
ncbi:unnamed protein product, partial [Iphiclides podalirius]